MYPEFGNYQAVILTGGTTYSANTLGNGATATTLNRFYCVSAGTMTMTLIGGGTFTTAPMTPGQEFYALPCLLKINSGSFVGFRAKGGWGHMRITS